MMFWLDISWQNTLKLLLDSFLIGFGWSAGCWLFGKLIGLVSK